ncbi:PREDICTED: ankyrin-2 [Lupinus angustifolius]|uniref:ankyrin-2 n=1 Tax=Lupinus angustifolius TaxID=3871 RepID=UPI00092F9214|nr:PREDICTED: ankyrin-2 [Lupinus angustifolius]
MNTVNDYNLKAAAQEGDINLLYRIIEEDPYVLEHLDIIPFVETPLHVAASMGYLHFATEIMRLKPSFAWKLNKQGFSPIHLALQHGQRRMVQCLVDINKELVRVKGREGVTPLHFVSQCGDIDLLANFLLACPNSIEDVNVRSETALHIAVKNKQHEALEVLVGWLKRSSQRGAMQLEKTTLNWKDESGNTVLHISALLNDSQALGLLIKTKMDLKAKNLENLTAMDIAASAEIKGKLVKAGVKCGSSTIDDESLTLAHKLRSKITTLDKIIIYMLRIREDISEEQRNAFLVLAVLIATATYQAALNPPGGFYQANAGGNNNQNTSSGNVSEGKAGTSVMSEGDFFTLSIMNTLSFLVSTVTIFILTPSGIVSKILISPVFWLAYCVIYSVKVVSPTYASKIVNEILLYGFNLLFWVVYCIFVVVYKRLQGYRLLDCE